MPTKSAFSINDHNFSAIDWQPTVVSISLFNWFRCFLQCFVAIQWTGTLIWTLVVPRMTLAMWIIDNTTYNAVQNGEIALPCNITAPSFDDGVSLILWYRDDIASPIYTVDARQVPTLETAQHFLHTDIFQNRATFNLSYPLSFLRIKPVNSSDSGEYRCRVDFRRARTINRILKLSVIVPTKNVVIYDKTFKTIDKVAGPFDEDSSASLICDASEGNPLPVVNWWKGSDMIDSNYFVVNNSIVRNVLALTNLTRDDVLMSLTCQAYNTNLTVPVTKTITLDLHLKPKEIRIITPLQNISSQSAIELACQCSGSKPSAKIKWQKGNEIIEPFSETVSDDGMTTTSFVSIVPSIADNEKIIVCTGFNPKISQLFSIQDTWPINIYYLPILSLIMGSNSRSQDIIEGSNVYFDCNIKANPYVTKVGWKLNGHILEARTMPGIEMRNTSLLVTNVNHDHYGEYQCFAYNSVGYSQSEAVFLNVKYAPKCRHSKVVLIGVALTEEVQIECQVYANPSDFTFEWKLNQTTHSKHTTLLHTDKEIRKIAKFIPTSPDDFGFLYCWARNNIGIQSKPCVFQIIKAEPPSPPHNCTLVNKTAHSLTLECLPGYSGGLDQTFYIEVYSLNPTRLLKNQSNTESSCFTIDDLPAGYIFKLAIYSINRKGRSKTIEITGSTTVPSPWKSAEFDTTDIYTSLSPFALIIGLALALAFVGTFVLVVLKIRRRLKSRTRTTLVYSEKTNLPTKSIMKKQHSKTTCNEIEGETNDTIEINDIKTFTIDYSDGRQENYPANISCPNGIAQTHFVPSRCFPHELSIAELHAASQQQLCSQHASVSLSSHQPTPAITTFSYDLCSPI